MAKLKGFDFDSIEEVNFEPLELNRDVARGKALHMGDVHNLVDALDDLGFYDKSRLGKPPLVQESLFKAIEDFQVEKGLKVDGAIRRNGPTAQLINQALRIKSGGSSLLQQDMADDDASWSVADGVCDDCRGDFDLIGERFDARSGAPQVGNLPLPKSIAPGGTQTILSVAEAVPFPPSVPVPRIPPVRVLPPWLALLIELFRTRELNSGEADCNKEWEEAEKACEAELAKPYPNRAFTGGHRTVRDCAPGHVSERCGGNPLDRR